MGDGELRDMDNLEEIEKALIRLRNGDLSARGVLIAYAYDQMRIRARQLVRQSARARRWVDVDDICQSATIKLFRQITRSPPDSLSHMISIAVRATEWVVIEVIRSLKGLVPPSEVFAEVDPATYFPDQIDKNADTDTISLLQLEAFHQQIAALTPEYRVIAELHWYGGLSYSAVGRMLGIPASTVRDRWRKTRVELGKCVMSPANC